MIWIAHTAVSHDSQASDAGVLDEVHGIKLSLEELGYAYDTIAPESCLLDFIAKISQNPREDVVFNLVESYTSSSWGESWIAGLYEAFQIAYTGSPPATLSLCLDKRRTRAVLKDAGFPVAPAWPLANESSNLSAIEYPVILKPACRDASEGLTPACVVHNETALKAKIQQMTLDGFAPLLLEKFIVGREFSLALLQRPAWELVSAFEVDFGGLPAGQPHILCYEAKWKTDSVAYEGTSTNPMKGDAKIKAQLRDIAVAAVTMLGLRDYARVDFRYSQTGQLYIIDVNPNPDISYSGGFFRALAAGGLTFTQFVKQVVENALQRTHESKKIIAG